jgi:hypothetical protein
MNDINCAPALYDCAVQAVGAGRQVVTAVYWWSGIDCYY